MAMTTLSLPQRVMKRALDVTLASAGLAATGWVLGPAWLLATIDTGQNGLFTQERVGRDGNRFKVIKLRSMRTSGSMTTTVTAAGDPRITRLGRVWRRTKLDELPQLFNVLKGDMSFVGPRPDVPGFADRLEGDDRVILSVRPGITGPASLKYRDEEALLATVDDPETYNREVIYPDKVRLNREYLATWSLAKDIHYIIATVKRAKESP
jgi:lipopolysaccharide/colanic/teichoic acid biosynthesis glycosyltransferase